MILWIRRVIRQKRHCPQANNRTRSDCSEFYDFAIPFRAESLPAPISSQFVRPFRHRKDWRSVCPEIVISFGRLCAIVATN